MTFNNGKEFSRHEKIADELKLKAFFAHLYRSFEKGLNENQIGLVRQYV
jgi:transposase, IS30 family